jgi:ATP-dependent DNA helicase RecG
MSPTSSSRKTESPLETPVQYVKGVGPRRATALAKLGIATVDDLLMHVPRRYVDRSTIKKIRDLAAGEHGTFIGKVLTHSIFRTKRGEAVFNLALTDGTGLVTCKWFNQPYLANAFKTGEELVISGDVTYYRGLQVVHPEYERLSDADQLLHTGRVVPIYPLTEGISQKQIRLIMNNALNLAIESVEESLPEHIVKKRGLLSRKEAISQVHFPDTPDRGEEARRRIAFEELFYLELLLAMKRDRMSAPRSGIRFTKGERLTRTLLDKLDFELTAAQKRVLSEIRQDMAGDSMMNRLLQGDVGSGKTIVAVLALLIAVESGYQGAIMAPTEILAEQHYLVMKELLDGMGLEVVLLIGRMTKKEKEAACRLIESGEAQIVIGTHALIEEGVRFKSLGLVIIDEQHRFGVAQRAEFRRKGFCPDFLVMTATPIPRTLSLTLYGDLDISVIDELPPGRKKIVTKVVSEDKRPQVYDFVREEIAKGRQCYVVCPLIEESEKLDLKAAEETYKRLKDDVFTDLNVGLLHGRMKSDEKESSMHDFRMGQTHILVSTTVIEVGVDVPNVTVMIVEHSERFGLAQLHQLRGRIGRGAERSVCVLMCGKGLSPDARERLGEMARTNDGFKIAEMDLRLRGPGEFFGTRQHGLPEMRVADLIGDSRLLVDARDEAFKIAGEDPELLSEKNRLIRKVFLSKYKESLDLARVG